MTPWSWHHRPSCEQLECFKSRGWRSKVTLNSLTYHVIPTEANRNVIGRRRYWLTPVCLPQAYLQFELEEEARAMAKFYNSNVTATVCGRPVRISHSMTYPTIQVSSSSWLLLYPLSCCSDLCRSAWAQPGELLCVVWWSVWHQQGGVHRSDPQRQIQRRGRPEAGRAVRDRQEVFSQQDQERGRKPRAEAGGTSCVSVCPRIKQWVHVWCLCPQCFIEMENAEDAEKMAEDCKVNPPKLQGKRLTVYVSRKYRQLKHGWVQHSDLCSRTGPGPRGVNQTFSGWPSGNRRIHTHTETREY